MRDEEAAVDEARQAGAGKAAGDTDQGSGGSQAAGGGPRALEGRRILVTGASSGIGAQTARRAAAAGAHVALLARRQAHLEALAGDIDGVAVPVDLTDLAAASAAVATAADALDGLDAVVNSAGIMRVGPAATFDLDDAAQMFTLNVLALLAVTKAAVPHLRAAGCGDVINLGSLSGRRVGSGTAAVYSGSKFAVHAISEGLRRELLHDRIRVTVLAPGYVRTDLFDDLDPAYGFAERAARLGLPVGQVADEIVRVLALPPDIHIREVALSGLAQEG